MAIVYNPLFAILKERGHSATYWLQQNGMHAATVNKLRKNQRVNTDTINRLCRLLDVQPADLMEYIPD